MLTPNCSGQRSLAPLLLQSCESTLHMTSIRVDACNQNLDMVDAPFRVQFRPVQSILILGM